MLLVARVLGFLIVPNISVSCFLSCVLVSWFLGFFIARMPVSWGLRLCSGPVIVVSVASWFLGSSTVAGVLVSCFLQLSVSFTTATIHQTNSK